MSKSFRRDFSFGVLALLAMTVVACGPEKGDTRVKDVIEQAQKMTRNELYAKAIEELDGKEMNAVGNSSRGRTAQESFLNFLRGKKFDKDTSTYIADATLRVDFPQYKENLVATINWTQPKNNMIFSQISNDIRSANPTLSMTLIQDGSQIQSKMLNTGNLLNYIPKEWAGSVKDNGEPFALQSLNKVFMANIKGSKTFKNVWDFVKEGETPMFMGLSSEPVGKNFLLMLTREDYSNVMKEAFDALPSAVKTPFQAVVDAVAPDAEGLGLTHASAKYSLAWIKLWVTRMLVVTDDGPIMSELSKNSAADKTGLLVYSKLRSISETEEVSKNNVVVAAYQSDYKGIGGYMYKHYLQILRTSPLPWSSAAFIHYMTTTKQGFEAWGKDLGGYPSDQAIQTDHSRDGYVGDVSTYPVLNDKGYAWWTANEAGKGRLVIEDPTYASQVSVTVGEWIDVL